MVGEWGVRPAKTDMILKDQPVDKARVGTHLYDEVSLAVERSAKGNSLRYEDAFLFCTLVPHELKTWYGV